MKTTRLTAIVVTVCLGASHVSAQAPPTLTSQQRDLLQALITAVDRAPALTEPQDYDWLTHVLRVSDGSHYVAFSVTPPAAAWPKGPLVVWASSLGDQYTVGTGVPAPSRLL